MKNEHLRRMWAFYEELNAILRSNYSDLKKLELALSAIDRFLLLQMQRLYGKPELDAKMFVILNDLNHHMSSELRDDRANSAIKLAIAVALQYALYCEAPIFRAFRVESRRALPRYLKRKAALSVM